MPQSSSPSPYQADCERNYAHSIQWVIKVYRTSCELHAPDTPLINNDGEKLISLACNFQLTWSRYVFPFHCDFHLISFFFSLCFNFFLSRVFFLVSSDGKFPVSYSIVRRTPTNVSLRYIRSTAIMMASHLINSPTSMERKWCWTLLDGEKKNETAIYW